MPDENPKSFPVKYVLYSHYGHLDEKDFNLWNDGQSMEVRELPGIRFLISRFPALLNLLTAQDEDGDFEGLVVLFYALGLPEVFDGIAEEEEKPNKDALITKHIKLHFADVVQKCVDKELEQDYEMRRRIRFVTALDLFDIFARVKSVEADNLRWWFIGQTEEIHYDTPKIVEAIVRLRLLGNGVPVFRLDWDVLFSSEEVKKPVLDLGLLDAVKRCLKAYRLRLEEPSVATFLFSASYASGKLVVSPPSPPNEDFNDWRGAFATRVFPALPTDKGLIKEVRARTLTWEEYAQKAFREPLGNPPSVPLGEQFARRFYGFDGPGKLSCKKPAGIVQFGAHPLVSVISGAFFCMSDGAILDLPPFSNFSLNVSWIDDHLKYSLHRELRHFTSVDLELSDRELSYAKIENVEVDKARGRIGNLPEYVLNRYLPSLLWGTMLDAWINTNALIKFRTNDLSDDQKKDLRRITPEQGSGAVFPKALQRAAETGKFPFGDRYRLRKQLIKKGLARITEVRRLWASLTDGTHETFASIWARGEKEVRNAFIPRDFFSDEEYKRLTDQGVEPDIPKRALGIALDTHWDDEITEETQLNPDLRGDFDQVIEDTLQYVEWTIHWPGIVRIIRSIEQGTIPTDMSWRPKS